MIRIQKAENIIPNKKRKESTQKQAIRKLKAGEGFVTLKKKELTLRNFIRTENINGNFSFHTKPGGKVAVVRNW